MNVSLSTRKNKAYLVTVTPLIVLGADVLVGVLGALLQSGHVVPVLPVLVPQVICVGTGGDEAGGNTATNLLAVLDLRGSDAVLVGFVANSSDRSIEAYYRSVVFGSV